MQKNNADLAPFIDHTLLKPESRLADFDRLCSEAVEHRFAAVCVPPYLVKYLRGKLGASNPVKLCTVVGFPFGYSMQWAKEKETTVALEEGADEIDMVINLIALKSGRWDDVAEEVDSLTRITHAQGRLIKVIIESGSLTDEEIVTCCRKFAPLAPDFLKTSTGYAAQGASVHAVALLRKNLPGTIRIKASGGIKTAEFAWQLVEAGATRIGSSAGEALIKNAYIQS